MRNLGFLAIVALMVTGCSSGSNDGGGGGGGGNVYSCNIPADYYCDQINGTLDASTVSSLQSSCTTSVANGGMGGSFATAACSRTNAVATCGFTYTGGITETLVFYSPGWTSGDACAICSAIGGACTVL